MIRATIFGVLLAIIFFLLISKRANEDERLEFLLGIILTISAFIASPWYIYI